jgi:hypothetical protein
MSFSVAICPDLSCLRFPKHFGKPFASRSGGQSVACSASTGAAFKARMRGPCAVCLLVSRFGAAPWRPKPGSGDARGGGSLWPLISAMGKKTRCAALGRPGGGGVAPMPRSSAPLARPDLIIIFVFVSCEVFQKPLRHHPAGSVTIKHIFAAKCAGLCQEFREYWNLRFFSLSHV